MLQTIKAFMDKYINYRMAVAGALFLGITVFVINYPHGVTQALIAAAKQATYTFFAAGFITRYSENLALKLDNRALSLLLAILVPSCIAVGLTFIVHSLKGTPEPLHSTLPTVVTAPLGFAIVGRRRQLVALKRKHSNSAAPPPTEG